MTIPGSTSNAWFIQGLGPEQSWPGYSTMVTMYCDMCSDQYEDDIFEDEYDADRAAENNDWGVDIEVEGYQYDHVCNTCMDNIQYCEACEGAFDHENSGCYCCDTSLCSEYCAQQEHENYFRDNTRLATCEECGLENPYFQTLGECETTAASWQL